MGWEHRAPPCQSEEPPRLLPDIDLDGEEESSEPEDGTPRRH
jgi:hypothetical protein